ncbi:hypothetical protein [Pseudoalteromonas sp.]|uniref:hypothetical protein n=1 Tax=Pseudoalteromonas sp. TaxID=53249 RepID=UPI0035659F7B
MLASSIKRLFKQFGFSPQLAPIAKQPVKEKVAFIHIAKCGGISIDNALRAVFAQPGDKRLCRETSIAGSLANYQSPIETLEDCCDFSEHHLLHLQHVLKYFAQSNHSFISGHWGVNSEILKAHAHKRDFITVLRDPESRLKSNYIFNKLSNSLKIMPPNNINTDSVISEAKEIVFGRRGWQMANTQIAFIAGKYPKHLDDAKKLQSTFIDNLNHFKLVGFLEDLPSFKKQFYATYQKDVRIKKHNATSRLVDGTKQLMLDDLRQFFDDKSTKRHLEKICSVEKESYLIAKERHFE